MVAYIHGPWKAFLSLCRNLGLNSKLTQDHGKKGQFEKILK